MNEPPSLAELEDYAMQCLHAQNYPYDLHRFTLFSCSECRGTCFRVSIEHHTGSSDQNFRGIIWGECAKCGRICQMFTYTGEHRKPKKNEMPECDCGSRKFFVGQCERIEGEKGLTGFFDEGVIAGKCCICSLNKVLAFYD